MARYRPTLYGHDDRDKWSYKTIESKPARIKPLKIRGLVVAALEALLAGCTCTTISDEYSVADPGKSGALRYEKVADLDSRANYSVDVIPVVLRMKEGQGKRDPISDLHGIVWLCTVGLFPMWDTYERTWEVEVKTPLGLKSGTCTRTRREWCEDLYGTDDSRRVSRGGCSHSHTANCTAGSRHYTDRDNRYNSRLGFRLAASQNVNQ